MRIRPIGRGVLVELDPIELISKGGIHHGAVRCPMS